MMKLLFLTPGEVVELFPEHVEQRHHRHVKEEEARQARGAEVPKKRIYPNSHRDVHP